jgi:hypothetical protein
MADLEEVLIRSNLAMEQHMKVDIEVIERNLAGYTINSRIKERQSLFNPSRDLLASLT